MTSITTTSTSSNSNSNSNDDDSNNIGNNGSSSSSSSNSINSIEAEYNKIEKECNGWHRFYQEIRENCDREAKRRHFDTSVSSKPQNRCLNRYRDVNPYDHSLIFLHRGHVDYINANLVKFDRADRKYILTQGPLNDTVGHFWLMVWEQKTKAILMLNKLMEKKQVKCHQYWPERKGSEYALKLSEVNLSVEYLRCEEYMNFCRRWFKLTDLESQQSREIIQFHYTTWPDFGIPSSPVAFLQFLKQVRDSGALDPDYGPAVVHCSAGIGRSGTFCLVDCCLVLYDKEGDNNVSVKEVLSELRNYRMGLIQTADQLYFSYQAIIKGITLLKDPEFLDYREAPLISNDDDKPEHNQFYLDETPPPLPPRTHSLLPFAGFNNTGALKLKVGKSTQNNKPLPKIPTSESFNDDLYAAEHNNKSNKDALNNFINNEKNSDNHHHHHAYRPLPALPTSAQRQNSLDRVHESNSDENDNSDHDDADDSDEDDDAYDNLNNANNEHEASNERNGNNVSASSSAHERCSREAERQRQNSANEVKLGNGIQEGNQAGANSPENELKRRKRVERQSNIEQKVHEIKRKQRESEEGKQAAKKRRSLVKYIATGVIVGVICVYAYAKLT